MVTSAKCMNILNLMLTLNIVLALSSAAGQIKHDPFMNVDSCEKIFSNNTFISFNILNTGRKVASD